MAVISANNTFSVTEQDALVEESVIIPILSAPAEAPNGTGRLVHPTLGTYDYDLAPTKWRNIDSDIVVAPKWGVTEVLTGQKFTLWQGYDRDTRVAEIWEPTGNAKASMRNEQMRMLLDLFMNPPTPPSFIEWYPNYTTSSGYKVIITGFTVGGSDVELDYVTRAGLVTGEVTLTMQIAEKL